MQLKHFEFKHGKKVFQIPYFELIGNRQGQMGFVAGGIRGDDINSLNILRNFVRVAKLTELEKKISGVLLIFPTLNLPAVSSNSRFALEDNLDLFNEFTNSPRSLSQKLAFELSHNFFKKCDFGICFIDSRSEFDFLPNSKVYFENENILSNIGELNSFGVKFHFKTKSKKKLMPTFLRQEFGTSLSVFEVGSKREITTSFVKPSMNGIRNILAFHKMLPNAKKAPVKQNLISTKHSEKSKSSGILNLKVELGQKVDKNQKLGIIFDPIQQKEFPIKATKSGLVYAKRNTNFVQEGQILYYVFP